MSGGTRLPDDAGVVVVGGGAIGVSVAFHLAEAGVPDVLLLERDALGSGSTSKAAGGVRAQFSDPVNIALGARSLAAFERFAVRPGQEIDLRQPGYLFLLTTPDQVALYERCVSLQNSLGVQSRMLGPDEAASLSPGVRTDDVLAAAFHSRDGYCSPESVVLGYATGARRLGARIHTGVEVTGIDAHDGEVRAVVTRQGEVRTTAVVLATGAWSQSLAGTAGLHLPVTPLRRQILVTQPIGESAAALLPGTMPMTIDASSTFYLHREGPGVLFGMSYQDERPGFDVHYSDEWTADLMDVVSWRCPALLDIGLAHRWAGLYEVTPDHNALIGRDDATPGLLYATGFSGHGFLQAPAVGEIIRDLYLARQPFVDVSPLSADRFVRGDLRGEANIV